MKKILALSDMHVGSMIGPMPRGFKTSMGSIINLNKGQGYVNECFQDFVEQADEVDALILNGDIIHGRNERETGLGVCEPSPEYQVAAAQELLEPLVDKADKLFCTSGTQYHTGDWGMWENTLAKNLDAEERNGRHAPFWWHLDVLSKHLDIAHNQSVMSRYPTSAILREAQFAKMIGDLVEDGSTADLILRSHAHRWTQVNVDGLMGLGLCAFCIQTPYAKQSKMPNRMISRYIGGAMIKVHDDKERSPDIEIEPIWYEHPKIEVVSI